MKSIKISTYYEIETEDNIYVQKAATYSEVTNGMNLQEIFDKHEEKIGSIERSILRKKQHEPVDTF